MNFSSQKGAGYQNCERNDESFLGYPSPRLVGSMFQEQEAGRALAWPFGAPLTIYSTSRMPTTLTAPTNCNYLPVMSTEEKQGLLKATAWKEWQPLADLPYRSFGSVERLPDNQLSRSIFQSNLQQSCNTCVMSYPHLTPACSDPELFNASSATPILNIGPAEPSSTAIGCTMMTQEFPGDFGMSQSETSKGRIRCPVCSKTYARVGTLKVHMRIHTGSKPYKCKYCLKTFTQSGNLVTHMRIHTGEKPFACPRCGKRYTQASGLRCHLKAHERNERNKSQD